MLNIVISGGSNGFGKSLAKEFIKRGDRVIIFSRKNIKNTIKEINSPNLLGYQLDATSINDMNLLKNIIQKKFKKVDAIINNAAYSGGYSLFENFTDNQLNRIINTNLLGSLLMTKKAIELFKEQSSGHIFFLSGSTNNTGYSVYGATKSGILQFAKNLLNEMPKASASVNNIGIHIISPGMMITPLLLENTSQNSNLNKIFNIFCSEPDTVAKSIVPKIRSTIINNKKNEYIRFLTIPKIIFRLFTFRSRKDKYIKE